MNEHRRNLLKAALAPLLLPLTAPLAEASTPPLSEVSEIRVIQTKDPANILERVSEPGFTMGLTNSVLGFLQDTHPTGNLPVWNQPASQVDLRSRIPRIADQVVRGVIRHASIYPVDPCWIMGQMMAESYFYEFAVSSALAVGPCQFISATARGYGLICADTRLADPTSIQRPDLDADFERATELRQRVRSLRRKYSDLFNRPEKILRSLLAARTTGATPPNVAEYGPALELMDQMQAQYAQARNNYRQFLNANFQNRSIFKPEDVAFFERFDQRVLHDHAINAMVRMMAENLRARGGNILAATAGYNAGLGNTGSSPGVYATYGRIPNFGETVNYVSKILVNHHEISRRI
ncbi:MAG: lytic transglycosylase domain-containing protein [Deltaproteobacteria bacterium]|nr:lytic transglycosylase domain-containing protein [Deltaproteobacteria bacterium]